MINSSSSCTVVVDVEVIAIKVVLITIVIVKGYITQASKVILGVGAGTIGVLIASFK